MRRFMKSLPHGSDECVYPVVVTVERRTLEWWQAGSGGAAQLVDTSNEGNSKETYLICGLEEIAGRMAQMEAIIQTSRIENLT